jgi:hypothetical protein
MYSLIVRIVWASLLFLMACGSSPPHVKERVEKSTTARPSTVTTVKEDPKPDPFHATSGPGDAAVAYVRDERSSRLDATFPKSGRAAAREIWKAPLDPQNRLKPCRGLCPPTEAAFVLTAGNRIAVTGNEAWSLFDSNGRKVDAGKVDGGGGVRIDRASGSIVADETRSVDTPVDARVAAHNGLVVMVKNGGVHVGERAIEGRFDAFDVAIDDKEIACVVVRQADDIFLWTVPLAASGSIGRHRVLPAWLGGARRAVGPPVLGNRLRVLVLDTGIVALGLDGKRVWERRGVPTGGVSITSDDHVLIADNGKILALDPRGKVIEVYSSRDKDVVFVTPPIINAAGLLLVASSEALHALSWV